MIQYLSVPKIFGEEYCEELKEAIYEIYNKIINDYGEKVVEIIEIPADDIGRYIIWAETDILFITNKRDGLYMSPLEYVIVRDAVGKGNRSNVLISEFVGGSRLLNGAFRFNPYNIREIIKCLETAVDILTPENTEKRFKSMLQYVNSHTIDIWAYNFLKDIKFVNQKRKAMLGYEGRQLLNNKLMMEKKKEYVTSREFINTYKVSKSRLIIILIESFKELMIETNSADDEYGSEEMSDVEMTDITIKLIHKLSEKRNTKVWLISSDQKAELHTHLHKLSNLGMAAEDGYFYRWHSKNVKNKNDWSRLIKDGDCSWIELVKSIMNSFTESTEGSYIVEKESMISWNYSKVAPDYGQGQMKEMN